MSKADKNAIKEDLMELYREVKRTTKILDDLLEDCTTDTDLD